MTKNILMAVTLVVAGALGALLYINLGRSDGSADHDAPPEFCVRHQIAERDCPWCDPALVEKKGLCPAHDVPEAVCSRCNPALIPGFKAENDWCAGHAVPESQCAVCRGEEQVPGQAPCTGKDT